MAFQRGNHHDQAVIADRVVGTQAGKIFSARQCEATVPRLGDFFARSADVADIGKFLLKFRNRRALIFGRAAVHDDYFALVENGLARQVRQARAQEFFRVVGGDDDGHERFRAGGNFGNQQTFHCRRGFGGGHGGRRRFAREETDFLAASGGFKLRQLGGKNGVVGKFFVLLEAGLADKVCAVIAGRGVNPFHDEARIFQRPSQRCGREMRVMKIRIEPEPFVFQNFRAGGTEVRHHAAEHSAGAERGQDFFKGAARRGQMFEHMAHRHHAQAAGRDLGFFKLRVHHGNLQLLVRVTHAGAGEFHAARLKTLAARVEQQRAPAAADIEKTAAGRNELQNLGKKIIALQPVLRGLGGRCRQFHVRAFVGIFLIQIAHGHRGEARPQKNRFAGAALDDVGAFAHVQDDMPAAGRTGDAFVVGGNRNFHAHGMGEAPSLERRLNFFK